MSPARRLSVALVAISVSLGVTGCVALFDLSEYTGGAPDAGVSPDAGGATSNDDAAASEGGASGGDGPDASGPRYEHLGALWRTDDARTADVEATLGAPAADRRIIVVLAGKGDRIKRADSGFGVVVNGVTATLVGSTEHDDAGFDVFGFAYTAPVPMGDTGKIQITFGAPETTFFSFAISWFAGYGGFGESGKMLATKAGNATPLSTAVTCKKGGLVLATGAAHESGLDPYWTFVINGSSPFGGSFQEKSTKHFEGIGWHTPVDDWVAMPVESRVAAAANHKVLWVAFE